MKLIAWYAAHMGCYCIQDPRHLETAIAYTNDLDFAKEWAIEHGYSGLDIVQ